MRLLQTPHPSITTGKLFLQGGISRVADSGARIVATGALRLHLKPTYRMALSLAGTGNWNEGNRRVQAAPDGIAPENAEQEPFRDSVERGTIGEATSELQFGTGDSNASNELSKKGKSGRVIQEEDKAKEDPKAESTRELWGSKDDEGSAHAFLDDEKKVDFRGDEDLSVLGELGSWRRAYRKSD